jgi:hypothetical protein
MPTACTLSMTALNDAAAVHLGGVELGDCVVITSISNRVTARRLQAEHGFGLRLVPDCLLRKMGAWALFHESSGSTVWSDGVW